MPYNLGAQGTITCTVQRTPKAVVDVIQTTIKEEKNFWYYKDDIDEPIHILSNFIIELLSGYKFSNNN